MSFKKDMLWGAATAAYQIEGGFEEDGKGKSVWDVFCERKGAVKNGDTGNTACDHYHLLNEDIRLLKELGVNTYRFSFSWPRIIPDGTGKVNQKGIDFYNRLIDGLLENGITPFATLFHWDFPYELDKKGGWLNPKSPEWFENYAKVIADNFGDRVKMFATFNEPQVFMGHGHFTGLHAPGKKYSLRELTEAAFNVLLSHGKAVRILRENVSDCKIGYVSATSFQLPLNNTEKEIETAYNKSFGLNSEYWVWHAAFWCDPVFKGGFEKCENLKQIEKYLPSDYEEKIKTEIYQPLDFCGLNIYNGNRMTLDENGDFKVVSYGSNEPRNSLGWPITPEAMYYGPMFAYKRYGLPIIICENGFALNDTVSSDGLVHDPLRTEFMKRYLSQLEKAQNDGADIKGYFAWSFMDNFEWAEGYEPRFGLVYVDYNTKKRIKKDSFFEYKKIIENNG